MAGLTLLRIVIYFLTDVPAFPQCWPYRLQRQQLGFDHRVSRKPAPYPYVDTYHLFPTATDSLNTVEVWPHAPGRLWCPAFHHFKATPTSLRPLYESCRFHPTWNVLTTLGDAWRRWDLRSYLRYLSPHGVGQCSQLRKSDPPLHLPAPEPMATLFVTVKLINEFLVAL